MSSKLTFERKFLEKNPHTCSEDRTYIDFVINGVSFAKLLGGVGNNIGKFGWKTNIDFELSEFNAFKNANKSRLDNGLFSSYVCPECGDEGCGAVMFQIQIMKNEVKWTNFVWSDGYPDEEDEEIKIQPIVFNLKEYESAMIELKAMIIDK